MKRKVFLCVSFILVILLIVPIVINYRRINALNIPEVKDIKSIGIVPGKVGWMNEEESELYFDLNKKEHLNKVKDILSWLKSGIITSENKRDYLSHGYTPTCLLIELKDGRELRILASADTTITKINDQMYSAEPKDVPRQVSIYDLGVDKRPVRELSPKLRSFIDEGWKSFFKVKD